MASTGDYTTWFVGDYHHPLNPYQPTSIVGWDRGVFNGPGENLVPGGLGSNMLTFGVVKTALAQSFHKWELQVARGTSFTEGSFDENITYKWGNYVLLMAWIARG